MRAIGLTVFLAALFICSAACAEEARRLIVNVNPKGGYYQFEAYGFSRDEVVRIVEVTSSCKVDFPDLPDQIVDMRVGVSGPDTVLRALFEVDGYEVKELAQGHYAVTKIAPTVVRTIQGEGDGRSKALNREEPKRIGDGAAVRIQDGLSAATAVILKPGSIEEGVASENAWLEKHHPGYQRCPGRTTPAPSGNDEEEIVHFAHRTETVAGRMISVLCVVLPNGTERDFYFDITDCYNAQIDIWSGKPGEPTPGQHPPEPKTPSTAEPRR